MTHTHFLHCNIAGFSFWEWIFVFEKLNIWTELTLKLETENPYDPNAVAIYFKTYKIWYIPRAKNKRISKFLHAGYENIFETRINRISSEEYPEEQIWITVFLKSK